MSSLDVANVFFFLESLSFEKAAKLSRNSSFGILCRSIGGTYRLNLQGRRIRQGNRVLLATYFHADFLHCLFFDPEDGGKMFLRNFC
jgi:hypothetical protein